MPRGIYNRSLSQPNPGLFKKGRIKIAGVSKGDKMSVESRQKMSDHWKKVFVDETKHPMWKGEEAGYSAKHRWIYKKFGMAVKCEAGKGHESKQFEWSNISGDYLRVREDWRQLCQSCHRKYDYWRTRV